MEHAGDVIPQLAAAAPGNEFVAYFASLLPWFFKRMVSFGVMALAPPPSQALKGMPFTLKLNFSLKLHKGRRGGGVSLMEMIIFEL